MAQEASRTTTVSAGTVAALLGKRFRSVSDGVVNNLVQFMPAAAVNNASRAAKAPERDAKQVDAVISRLERNAAVTRPAD